MNKLLKVWAVFGQLRDQGVLLYFAWRHPYTPTYIKTVITVLLLYVVSPLDFIPDYLPLIGIADDLAILPAGLFYITRLLPQSILDECRRDSIRWSRRLPYIAGLLALIGMSWIAMIGYGIYKLIFQ